MRTSSGAEWRDRAPAGAVTSLLAPVPHTATGTTGAVPPLPVVPLQLSPRCGDEYLPEPIGQVAGPLASNSALRSFPDQGVVLGRRRTRVEAEFLRESSTFGLAMLSEQIRIFRGAAADVVTARSLCSWRATTSHRVTGR